MTNNNDIIKMAREAGAWSQQFKNRDVDYVMSAESLERLAALVAAAEREECVRICCEHWLNGGNAMECADAIRERGKA